jgi:hypothetical protein
VAPCRGQHLDDARLGAIEHGRQVTDHTAGSLGLGQLDRPVKSLDNITEPARHLKDRYLTYDTRSGMQLRSDTRTPG